MTFPVLNRLTTAAWCLILLLSLMLVGRTLALVYDMVRPMPYWDAWEFMKKLPTIFAGQYTLGDLLGFHNEHRIVTTRLLMLADLDIFDGSGYLPTVVMVLLLCVIGCLLSCVTVGRNWHGVVVAALTTSLLLSVAQAENYASGFQVQFPLVDLSAIISIGLFAISCMPGRSTLWIAGAVIADAVAVGSMASGNTVIGPVILVAIALRAPPSRIAAFVFPVLALTAAYLVGFPKSEIPPSHDVVGIVHFAVNYLGSALRGYTGASLWLGAGLLAAYAAVVATIARSWWRKEGLDLVIVWLAGVAAFTVIGALVTATGRLSLGLETAISSRYSIQSLLFASCIFLMGWRSFGVSFDRNGTRVSMATAFLALSAASTLAASPMNEWRQRVATYDAAGEAFANGVFSDHFVVGVYPYPELVRPALTFMVSHRLGPFSERYADVYRPPTNAMAGLDVDALPACSAARDDIQASGSDWREVSGWIFSPDRPADSGWVLAFDSEQRLLGYARQSIVRHDVSEAYHLAVARLGFRIGLNMRHSGMQATKLATLILLPDSPEGYPCRASTPDEGAKQ